jgi:hypothetical protein
MNFPDIDYAIFRYEDSNTVMQAVLYLKSDNWYYFMLLEPDPVKGDLELFAKFSFTKDKKINAFLRYHLNDDFKGWQGKIESDKVTEGEVTSFNYNPISDFTTTDRDAFNQLNSTLFKIVKQDDEDGEDIVVNEELLELMEDEVMWASDTWMWFDGWVPEIFQLYYQNYWHGEVIDL